MYDEVTNDNPSNTHSLIQCDLMGLVIGHHVSLSIIPIKQRETEGIFGLVNICATHFVGQGLLC